MLLSQSKLRPFFRFDCVITIAGGLIVLLFANNLISLLGLGDLPLSLLRTIGAIWLAFGLWLLVIWNRAYSKPIAIANALILGANGLLLFYLTLFGGYQFEILGTIVVLANAIFISYVALQWWLLSRQL